MFQKTEFSREEQRSSRALMRTFPVRLLTHAWTRSPSPFWALTSPGQERSQKEPYREKEDGPRP